MSLTNLDYYLERFYYDLTDLCEPPDQAFQDWLGGIHDLWSTGVICSADLEIEKTDASDPVGVGELLTYTLTVANNGPTAASGVTVTDTLPASVVFDAASASHGSCVESGGVVTCDLDNLTSGTETTINIEVTPTSIEMLTNNASVTAIEPDRDTRFILQT